MTRAKWLDKTLLLGPHMTLCISDEEFQRVLKMLPVTGCDEPWLHDHANAEVHTFYNEAASPACVVCIKPGIDEVNAALVLSHEALHIFRRWMEHIGECSPGEEIEAHGIKNIAVTLTTEYLRRTDA